MNRRRRCETQAGLERFFEQPSREASEKMSKSEDDIRHPQKNVVRREF